MCGALPSLPRGSSRVVAGIFLFMLAFSASETATIRRVFFHTGGWHVVVDGRQDLAARVWESDDGMHFVIQTWPSRHPIFVSPYRGKVLLLDEHVSSVQSQDRVEVDLPVESPRAIPLDLFEGRMVFAVERHYVEVRRAPEILGLSDCGRLLELYPGMAREAERYTPSHDATVRLRGSKDRIGRLDLFFGTWCGLSAKLVPRIIRVARDAGVTSSLSCYGIGMPVRNDDLAKSLGISGVPTLIVTTAGGTIERIPAAELHAPEQTLLRVVGLSEGVRNGYDLRLAN